MKKLITLWSFLLLAGFTNINYAQLSVDALNTNYTINFDNSVTGVVNGPFAGSGLAPSPTAGQLDSDGWATNGMSDGSTAFGATATSGDYARGVSTGGVVSGGFYGFEVAAGNIAFGNQPTSSDWSPGSITLKVLNNTSSPIGAFDISYNIMVYNDQSRANSFNFAYSFDDVTYYDVPSLDYVSTELPDPSPAWVTVPKSFTISSINIPDAGYIYLRWHGDDVSGGGSRDEFAVDDIVVNASAGTVSSPTHLAVAFVNGGNSPTANQPFDVVVQAQDDSNIPQNTTSNVNVQLSLATGTGNLGGTLTGTILSGSNSVTVSGVTYDVAETGVSIIATDLGGGLDPGTSATFEVIPAPTSVANLAALRAGTLGEDYTVSGEVVLTFQQSFNNLKFVQDGSAAIQIYDPSGVITTAYNIGDGIINLTGTLTEYGNMLEFEPLQDPGTPNSTGNTITPEVITLADLNTNFENYEAELVKINSVTFTDAGGTFATGEVYPITDPSKGTFNFRTNFYDEDYIGTTIPNTVNLICLPNSRPDGDYVTSRSLADFEILGLPTIIKAYALNDTDVDVYYNIAPGSVNSGDFNMNGTTFTTFSGATIDAGNDKLVHLTGASPAMTGDATIDELIDDAYGSSYQFYAGITPIKYTNTTNPSGTISDDVWGTFTGVVSANDENNNVWISDASGAYNGVMIYDAALSSAVAVGDEILIAAQRSPFNNLTELGFPELLQIVSSGNTPFGPTLIDGSSITADNAVDTNPAESFEGQLVKINTFTVDSISAFGGNFACSWVGLFGTYVFYVGDNAGTFSLIVGSSYTSITGLVDYYWSAPYYRINPRSQDDIVGGVVPPTPDVIITEIMQNPAAVGDGDGEYFELFNNETTPVDITGWIIKDNDSDSHTIGSSLSIPAKGFVVLGNNGDPLANGGYVCDYVYTGFALANGDDEVVITMGNGAEVDRVEYDGGAVWPDPTGASMTYTGFASEDNNDGTKWVWSTFREASYDDSQTDKGSPGSNGYDQIVSGGFKLDLKVYLESPYVDPDSLSNYFRDNGMLPYYSPFSPILPYYGNNSPAWYLPEADTLSFVPFNASDWVLVELRDAATAAGATPGTVVAQMPALVLDDGTVVSMNGYMPLNVGESFTNDLYIVVWNLNHLGIMSSTGMSPVSETVMTYNFTSGSGQVYGGASGYKEVAPGVWGMASGDVNGDETINANDKVDGWATEVGEPAGYQGSNLFIDDQVNNQDKNEMWAPNSGMSSQVPN